MSTVPETIQTDRPTLREAVSYPEQQRRDIVE